MSRLRYIWSWLTSDFVGVTVCKVLDHKRPAPEVIRFMRWLADIYNHPPDSEARDLICVRCGGTIEEEE
jgi:hypothetical protein